MISSLKSVVFNVASYEVALLHKTLAILGLPVAPEEVAQKRAGEDTRAKTRALQARFNVPHDESRIIDDPTVAALSEALKRLGFINLSRAFEVSGVVRGAVGTVGRRRRLVAFDLDLRGVGAYREPKTLAELETSGGFDLLGVVTSNQDGAYRLMFYDWQYSRAERKKADVVVFAFEPGEPGGKIVGRSRLVDTNDYSGTGLVRDLDVILFETDTRTEYEIVMTALVAFLKESGVGLVEVAASAEQLAFCASELDLDLALVTTAADAALVAASHEEKRLSHELLYAIGRRAIPLEWGTLLGKKDDELRAAIAESVEGRIVRAAPAADVTAFLAALQQGAIGSALQSKPNDGANGLSAMLSNVLPKESQRVSFMNALGTFTGADFTDFWRKHLPAQPEFKDDPTLVSSLLMTQRLTALTGNHQPLVAELQVGRKIATTDALLDLEKNDWVKAIKKAGVPTFVDGPSDDVRAERYADQMQAALNAAFPMQRILRMVQGDQLPIEDPAVSRGIAAFLAKTPAFDIARSRVHDFAKEIAETAGEAQAKVTSDLLKVQRVFQVSTRPEVMAPLMRHGLTSAYTISNIPRRSFIRTYGQALGGDQAAYAIHQRAEHIATRAEMIAMHMREYADINSPKGIMGKDDLASAQGVLENQVPNYSTLFGSPDICECEHCRSVFGPAAYFVDLLRFLWRGAPNTDGKSPLDMLAKRRPDLLHLPLTCENTNTVIPYIDLVNEVMEYYAADDSVSAFQGHDTGDATSDELRANPQNFDLEAYRKLKDAKYPFTLPYHQPVDVIRIYSDHLKVGRYEAMRAINPGATGATVQAIAAEGLRISQEEHQVLTGKAFDGAGDSTALDQYYGYRPSGEGPVKTEVVNVNLEKLSAVPEFMARSGVAYTDLVELVRTLFVNPHQVEFEFLERIASCATTSASSMYEKLEQIEPGTLDPATDAAIAEALAAYNEANRASVTPALFGQWITDHLDDLRKVITLYEPDSKCDLDTTTLRTIESIYEGMVTSGVTHDDWSKIHRFLRLWRKLGWTIHETDLILAALGEDDITDVTIAKLEAVVLLKNATKLPLDQLAVMWGHIDSYPGKKSLYRKLFLNKAVQQIDEAFEADAFGDYLTDTTEPLGNHRSAIVAAYRLREEDLAAILGVAQVIDGGQPRLLDPTRDNLSLANLSTIYRHVSLAKALKMRPIDLCKLITVFNGSPFSRWDIQAAEFTAIDPAATLDFYKLAGATKTAGFRVAVLEYVLKGTLQPESTIGLDTDKIQRAAMAARGSLSAIEQNLPGTPHAPLTLEALGAKLALTFQPDVAARLLSILDGTAVFETIADANLAVVIPTPLSEKVSYVKGSGRLTAIGVMTDAELAELQGLPGGAGTFSAAVQELHDAPQLELAAHFDGIFDNLSEANGRLLDHPAQPKASTFEEKLAYVYTHFIPPLKRKLRRDAITQHIAALIGLSLEATSPLIAGDVEKLIADLSTQGFSSHYFADDTWAAIVEPTITDPIIDFDWGAGVPRAGVLADRFSVRWDAYVAPPASGDYTLVVDVAEADETFKLYIDDTLILEKTSSNTSTSLEVVTTLNAARMHRLRLDYAEATGNASVKLRWKTATTGLEVLPPTASYPGALLDEFAALCRVYHRAAKLIVGFNLSESESDHLISFSADFGAIDFKALRPADWRRVYDYTTLRNTVPQAQALLTDLFAAANTPSPAPTLEGLKTFLVRATAWDHANVDFLVDTHFALTVADFKNEIALNRLRAIMDIVTRTGLSAETIVEWGAAQTDFDLLHTTAQLLKNAVKAKHEDEDWLKLAGNLSDALRHHQQQALIGYLLTRPDIQAWGARDADALFEYFLIDVQMDACMDTSRVVQTTSAVQMFVNRCLLNLESEQSTGKEKGVSPSAIDKDRWEWMKAYRVWEANRKVFLYPENWLEPEWRNDRSEFFKELEGYLLQNDITDRTVEQGFRDYLTSLSEVANLEVCGLVRENYDNGKLRYMHVFGRTHNAPYKFFYRRWDEFGKWSAWAKVQVDIRCIEGDAPGVHLIPVVWKNRLYLFWTECSKRQLAPNTSRKSVIELSEEEPSRLAASEIFEVRLAWTEYADGKWSPKQRSKEYLYSGVLDESKIRFVTDIDVDNRLSIYLLVEAGTDQRLRFLAGEFILSDIASRVSGYHPSLGTVEDWDHYDPYPRGDPSSVERWLQQWDQVYTFDYMNSRATWSKLERDGVTYLQANTNHKLLLAHNIRNQPAFDEPFFFSDQYRSYFVRPVDDAMSMLVEPERYKPVIPKLRHEPRPRGGSRNTDLTGSIAGPLGRPVASKAAIPIPAEDRAAAGFASRASEDTFAVGYGANKSAISKSFGGVDTDAFNGGWKMGVVGWCAGLEFHTFHHPYSNDYLTNLNRSDLPGLMESDAVLRSDEGALFERVYAPSFAYGGVVKPADFRERTYYKENVCFDRLGANSIYNWELFFHGPLYIATRLSKNGRYEEAMRWFHYIFDPTTDTAPAAGQSEVSRYWKVLPFKTTPALSLEGWFRGLEPNANPASENSTIKEWRTNPFDPHLIASDRPLAYMKHVVIKYVENLLAWGDSLFRQDSRESVNEALQIYVIANHILGPRPQFVPKRGAVKAESYKSLENKWDDFSNALVALENVFPYSSEASVSSSSTGTGLLGVGPTLYFGIPANEKLLDYWDTVADRLYKIRHCLNIDGVERKLALFAPPIEPSALIQAASQGLSLGSILADLSSPPPIYRFTFLIQKANEFCTDVKGLGASLLAAFEKKEAEELARLRATQEIQMLELMTAIREHQVLAAKVAKENLEKSRETAKFRMQHFIDMLGNDAVTVPPAPSLPGALHADSQLPADTNIPTIESDVDQSLAETDEAGVKILGKEKLELDKLDTARDWQIAAKVMEAMAAHAHVIPTVSAKGSPLGVGTAASWGGTQLGNAFHAAGSVLDFVGSFAMHEATIASKMAMYIRREQDWTLQANLASRDIVQIDKQITSADIQIQVATTELANHRQSFENAKTVELFLKDKFTNQELYQWMKEQLFAVYKQAYNLAYDMAKKAEKAYKREIGVETASFIQYGYWDDATQGLVAGERLQLGLRQLEKSYLEENRRELELSKNVSLARLDPQALIELRETGRCWVSLPEELFDLDFRGHYFRRLRAVRLSIPCVAGPLTTIGCTLRLLGNSVRINTSMNSEDEYEHENDAGLLIDDERFRTTRTPTTAIATCQAQNASGLFEFSFRDERYLPFEGAGAISHWQIELSTDEDLRQFDYSTISDVILHLSYTAREAGGVFKTNATTYIKKFLTTAAELAEEPLAQMFDMKHEFPNEWHEFLHPSAQGSEQILRFTLAKDRFPFFVQDRGRVVSKIELFARCTENTIYDALLLYVDLDETEKEPDPNHPIKLGRSDDTYGSLNTSTIDVNSGLALEEIDLAKPMSLRLKRASSADYTALVTDPDEVTDLFVVLSYRLEPRAGTIQR